MSVYGPRPKGVKRPKSQARQRDEEPGKASAARRFKSLVCGTLSASLEAHHALPKSWLKDAAWREGLRGIDYWYAVYDPRIGIPLTVRRHSLHTTRTKVIPFEELPQMLVYFVAQRWGEAGLDALRREHPPR